MQMEKDSRMKIEFFSSPQTLVGIRWVGLKLKIHFEAPNVWVTWLFWWNICGEFLKKDELIGLKS